VGGQVGGVEVQDDVPAQRLDHRDHLVEAVEVGGAAQVGDEVDPGAPDPGLVEGRQVIGGERLVDHRHPGEAAGAAPQGVDHRGVVGAVAARLHEHGPGEAEVVVQPDQIVDP